MFWSGETLLERLPALSDDFKPGAVDCNAWTLTIGDRLYITPTATSGGAPDRMGTIRTLGDQEHFVIPPGQFGFLETRERVRVPKEAMALISIKASVKLQGLVNVSGFHVDPGFDGVLVFTVYNAGPNPIHLQQGQNLFLIWYASLDQATKLMKTEPSKRRVDGESVKGFSGKLQSLDDFAERLISVERKVSIHTAVGHGIAALAIATVAAVLGVFLTRTPAAPLLNDPVGPTAAISADTPFMPVPSTWAAQ